MLLFYENVYENVYQMMNTVQSWMQIHLLVVKLWTLFFMVVVIYHQMMMIIIILHLIKYMFWLYLYLAIRFYINWLLFIGLVEESRKICWVLAQFLEILFDLKSCENNSVWLKLYVN